MVTKKKFNIENLDRNKIIPSPHHPITLLNPTQTHYHQ